jgi:hypothetical protein
VPTRVDVSQVDVLLAVTGKLRSDLGLTESTCYMTLSAQDPPAHWMGNEDSWQLLVSGSAGVFDEGLFLGGGRRQCMEAWQFVVGIYTRIHLDQSSHDEEAMVKANRGIYSLKALVLDCLAGKDITIQGYEEEESSDSTDSSSLGEFWLREMIRPVSASQPMYLSPVSPDGEIGGPGVVQMLLGFSVPFDWDLEE